MTDTRRACLIYVSATAGMRAAAREQLEANGYSVCEVRAELEVALAPEARVADLPSELADCIAGSVLCVFLIPENEADDGLLGGGGGRACQLTKPFIGVVEGMRELLPQAFDDHAAAIVRDCGIGLARAIRGDRSFVKPDGSRAEDRKIDHVRCQ